MDLQFIITAAVVLVLGSALQSAAGFGFGMFAIPLLIMCGAESYEAIAILSICGTVQTIIGVYTLRRHVHWRQVAGMILLAGAMLPLGVWTLHGIVQCCPVTTIRQIFGAIVLCAVLAQWWWRMRPRDHLHWGWGAAATVLCGYMSGLAGMGGPPVVMWVMAHRWSNQRSRATLWTLFTGLTPFQFFFLTRQFGDEVLIAYRDGALLSPVMLLGILPGLWIGHRIPKPLLRQMSYAILLLISLYAILQPPLSAAWSGR
jgi:uncharacterized membrane protein YfcA